MIKLDDALANVSNLGFDTPPLIYFVEANPRYDALVTEVFQRIADGKIYGFTSVVALCEVLVQPLRHQNSAFQQSYRDLLLNSDNFTTYPITASAAEQAAELRSVYRLRTPDAMQIAVALETRCEAFLTNDATLQRVKELRVLVLDQLGL